MIFFKKSSQYPRMKTIMFAFCAFVSSVATVLYFRSSPPSEDTLIVGMMSGWAPFMTINSEGVYEGFDVDVATKLAQAMNKKLVIKDFGSLAPSFIALEQNKIDILMSGLDITQQRTNKLSMVRYTGQDVKNFYLVFYKTIPSGIETITDLQKLPGVTICAEAGSAQEAFLDLYAQVTKKPMPAVQEMIMDVRFGKSAAVLLEPSVAARFKRAYSDLVSLEVPLPESFQVYGCGIAIKKTNAKLTQQVEDIITTLKNDSTLEQLETKWQLGAQS